MNRIAIMGLGLMGGSLGLALKKRCPGIQVAGYARRPEVRSKATETGVVDSVFENPADAVRGADLIVFCVPVLTIPNLIVQCKNQLSADCVVTDVGSTKATLVEMASEILSDVSAVFVGSHPMAGSDETGLEAARDDLYEDSTVVLTPQLSGTPPEAVARVRELWSALCSRIVEMSPQQHDRIVARTSHLPHMVAAALVSSVLRDGHAETASLCGNGFLDTTRIAAGSELMWHDIIKTNSVVISDELALFEESIGKIRRMIDAGDFDGIREFLADSRSCRKAVERPSS